jgi:hypothetical protein
VAGQTRNAKNVTIRMHTDELQALLRACEALSSPDAKVDPSQLLSTAAVEESIRLGFAPSSAGGSSVRPRPGTWEYAPPEREESYRERITITIHPLYLSPISLAVAWAGVELPRFLIGCMWRWLALRQRAEPRNRKLLSIPVPDKYKK